MLNFLKATMITLFLSMFVMALCNGAIVGKLAFTFSLTMFVVAVVINCMRMWKGKDIFNLVSDRTYDAGIEYFKSKKYVQSIVHLMSYPMCLFGMGVVVLDIICMWILVLK